MIQLNQKCIGELLHLDNLQYCQNLSAVGAHYQAGCMDILPDQFLYRPERREPIPSRELVLGA